MLFSVLIFNVKEKGKNQSNLTLSLTVVLTQMIFYQVLTCPKRYVAACSELTTIKDEIQAIHQDMQCLFQIDKRMKIPTALYQKLAEAFKCNICHRAPIAPPVIFARCCKAIVGCQICVDTWFTGDEGISKKYPLCGTDRALPDTMRLHGLDDFLVDPQNEHDNM